MLTLTATQHNGSMSTEQYLLLLLPYLLLPGFSLETSWCPPAHYLLGFPSLWANTMARDGSSKQAGDPSLECAALQLYWSQPLPAPSISILYQLEDYLSIRIPGSAPVGNCFAHWARKSLRRACTCPTLTSHFCTSDVQISKTKSNTAKHLRCCLQSPLVTSAAVQLATSKGALQAVWTPHLCVGVVWRVGYGVGR